MGMVFKETKILVQYLLKIFSKAFSCKMQPAWFNKSLCYRNTKKDNTGRASIMGLF